MRHAIHGNDGIHANRRAIAFSVDIVPIPLRLVMVAAVDIHLGILEQVIAVQRVGQHLATYWFQLRFRVDVDIMIVWEHRCVSHTDNFHVVGMDYVVGHVVFRAHAIELQGILLRNQRDELGGVAMNGQQILVRGRRSIGAKTLDGVVDMQAVGGHIPLSFLQRTDEMVHWEIEVAALVQIIVLHLLTVEVDVGAVVGRGEGHRSAIRRIKHEIGRISHESP